MGKISNIGDHRFCLYLHIRPDTNEVFYVGIGSVKRSGSRSCRNNLWQKIVDKNNGRFYREVICRNASRNSVCQMEVAIISFYGRIYNGSGILANLTAGGDGVFDYKYKREPNKSGALKIRPPMTEEACRNISEGLKRKFALTRAGRDITNKDTSKVYKGISDSQRKKLAITHALRGYVIEQVCRTTGVVLNTFLSIQTAARETNSPVGSVWKCVNGERITANCFIWRKSYDQYKIDILLEQILNSQALNVA